ncbi:F-box/associated interaction domain protein, partial [Arabidopsis thaliana]
TEEGKHCTSSGPEDLVVEILTRVPVVSLKQLRSTPKGWNALIKDGLCLDTTAVSSVSLDLHGIVTRCLGEGKKYDDFMKN